MQRPMWEKGGIIYALHKSIQGTHHVYFQWLLQDFIRFAAITAWRDRSRRRQREISLEYLTEEKATGRRISISGMLKSLGVSRSGYRAFLARKVSPTRLFLNAPLENICMRWGSTPNGLNPRLQPPAILISAKSFLTYLMSSLILTVLMLYGVRTVT